MIKAIAAAFRRFVEVRKFKKIRKEIRNRKPVGTELKVFLKIAKENVGNDPVYDFVSKEPEFAKFFN